ncbi:ArpU family phage packaging/lysis transcriptional regulator [Brevibacillus sp. SYSU BS000544]|uniref:ArpU family phage packaging/lysis transcriptional regulator n=1 Tax=Brevibacillus sp. SYSU BS000544 TaxID=3416443 RepID=UPI003CE53270
MNQALAFLLPKINHASTMKNVKVALDLARDFICMGFHPKVEVGTTAGYQLVLRSETNQFHSSTESAAIKNADIERMRSEHVRNVLEAVNSLPKKERELIMVRWFGDDDMTDIETYIQLDMTHATYYRLRSRAFNKLAHALKIEVYE